jgi:16S rRNA G527 N7-methylase RsmG
MNNFESFLKTKGFTEEQISKAIPKLLTYRDATLEWNNKVNLTAITKP